MDAFSKVMDAEVTNQKSPGSNDLPGVALWEVVSVVMSCLIVEWVVLALAGRSKLIAAIPVLLAIGFMGYSHMERGESLRDIGFRLDNFLTAWRLLLLPTMLAILLILLAAWLLQHSLTMAPWRGRFLFLPLWALFQQYVLNGFINRRAQLAFGQGTRSVLLVGIIFGLLHLPNPLLAMLTMIGGIIWAVAYQRHPNLLALALSHTVVSLTLALIIPGSLLNNLRVGFKYFG